MLDLDQIRDKIKIDASRKHVFISASIALLLAAGLTIGYLSDFPTKLNKEEKPRQSQLTQYQRNYVNCPEKYLPLCTKLSKIPTEEVTFIKAEEGKLYLRMENGKKMVAKIQEGGKDGYLIRIEE